MKYEAKAWKETEGACLRNFKEQAQIDSVNGALALRSQIEKIIDQIWEEGFDGIYFIGIGGTYASSMQVEVYMRGRSKLPVFVENAAEFLTTGNKKFTNKSVVIISSVSGNTKEMVELVDRVHEKGAKVFSFIDNPGTILTQPNKQDYLIVYPMNEQLKFYMVANYLMYKNGEFDDYDRYNKEMEANLADVLVQVEKDSDEWAYEYAKNKVAFWKEHKDYPLFQKEFGDIRFSDLAKQEQAKHFIWRKQIHLNQTPAVFVGNRKLPEIYTNEDLVYFLEYGVIGDL